MAERSLTCRGCGGQFQADRRRPYCRPECRPAPSRYRAKVCEGCGASDGVWRQGLCRTCGALSRKWNRAQYERERQNPGRPPLIVNREYTVPATQVKHKCLVCSRDFFPKVAGRTKCCSRRCGLEFTSMQNTLRATGGRLWVRSPLRRKCPTCAARFTGQGRYCSPSCRLSFKPVEKERGPFGTCRECGAGFEIVFKGAPRCYCSTECKAAAKRKQRAKIRQNPSVKAARRISKKLRNALARGANGGERVVPLRVFERDGWRCGLCGGKTLPSKRGTTHPRAPELDHIVAIALGGPHTYANTMCACRSCNGEKGAAARGQLPLFPSG